MSLPQNGLDVVQEMDEVRSPDFAGAGGGYGAYDAGQDNWLGGGGVQDAAQKDGKMAEGIDVGDLVGLIKQTEEAKASQRAILKQQE